MMLAGHEAAADDPGAEGDDHEAGAGRGAAPGTGQCHQYEHWSCSSDGDLNWL